MLSRKLYCWCIIDGNLKVDSVGQHGWKQVWVQTSKVLKAGVIWGQHRYVPMKIGKIAALFHTAQYTWEATVEFIDEEDQGPFLGLSIEDKFHEGLWLLRGDLFLVIGGKNVERKMRGTRNIVSRERLAERIWFSTKLSFSNFRGSV